MLARKGTSGQVKAFPLAPSLPAAPTSQMAAVKDSYVRDAYNSLSIEGYRAPNKLIAHVAAGGWTLPSLAADRAANQQLNHIWPQQPRQTP